MPCYIFFLCTLRMIRFDLKQAAYGAYAGYGAGYANPQMPAAAVPQSTAYGAYPPAYPAQVTAKLLVLKIHDNDSYYCYLYS